MRRLPLCRHLRASRLHGRTRQMCSGVTPRRCRHGKTDAQRLLISMRLKYRYGLYFLGVAAIIFLPVFADADSRPLQIPTLVAACNKLNNTLHGEYARRQILLNRNWLECNEFRNKSFLLITKKITDIDKSKILLVEWGNIPYLFTI